MRKIYRKLTKEQKSRGVIFSPTLSTKTVEQVGDIVHEVYADTPRRDEIKRNLLDDSFFDGSQWSYNIIRK